MGINRRSFLKTAAAGAVAVRPEQAPQGVTASGRVALVRLKPVPAPVATGIARLRRALKERGVPSGEYDSPKMVAAGDLMVWIAQKRSRGPESFSLSFSTEGGRRVLRASGEDPRGLGYALFDLADRVEHSDCAMEAQMPGRPGIEQPAQTLPAAS